MRRNKRERLMRNKLNPEMTENYANEHGIAYNDKHFPDSNNYDQNSRTDAILRQVKARKITRV